MGPVTAEIELINDGDLEMVSRNLMEKDEVKRIWVNALVDTGAIMLCINENIQTQLQFPVVDKRKAQLANNEIVECDEVLLGTIPLEDLDVLIHPQRQELIVNPEHPDFVQMKIT
jgi:predicted aspartyl protease